MHSNTCFCVSGVDSCTLVMNDGRYIGKMNWQPYGCMMHIYSELDTKRCFRLFHFLGHYNEIRFIGDSRIFELYAAFVKTTDNTISFKHNKTQQYYNHQLRLKIEYLFAPYLSHPSNGSIADHIHHLNSEKSHPSLVLIGHGVGDIINSEGSLLGLQQFKYNLTKLVPAIDEVIRKGTKLIWAMQEPINAARQQSIFLNNSVVDIYNNVAIEVSDYLII